MKVFVKDFSTTLLARIVIFGMQDNYDLYCGIENPSSPVYSSLYLSNFLPMLTLKNEGFRQGFLYNLASWNSHIWHAGL